MGCTPTSKIRYYQLLGEFTAYVWNISFVRATENKFMCRSNVFKYCYNR